MRVVFVPTNTHVIARGLSFLDQAMRYNAAEYNAFNISMSQAQGDFQMQRSPFQSPSTRLVTVFTRSNARFISTLSRSNAKLNGGTRSSFPRFSRQTQGSSPQRLKPNAKFIIFAFQESSTRLIRPNARLAARSNARLVNSQTRGS